MVSMDDQLPDDTSTDTGQGTSLFSHVEPPTASTRPKRTRKKATAPDPAATDEAAVPGEETTPGAAPGQDPEEETEKAAPPAPAFGLLFQAPDLSAVPARPKRQAPRPEPEPREGEEPDADEGGEEERAQDRQDRDRRDQDRQGRKRQDQEQRERDEASEGEDREGDDGDGSDDGGQGGRRRRRRGGKGRRGRADGGSESQDGADESDGSTDSAGDGGGNRSRSRRGGQEDGDGEQREDAETTGEEDEESGSSRRRRRRRRSGEEGENGRARSRSRSTQDEVSGVRGSTRLEAKRQRRREGREAGRRRTIITEAEFLARRESVERVMVVRGLEERTQIGVLEDGVLVEHYVSRETQTTMAGNVYLGRVQNVLPSMEAAFVDIGKGRNAVLYAGEVNWDAAGLDNEPKRIENALSAGQSVLVQVTKDPIGHKGARLTSQVSLPGRYLVYVPGNSMTGISRKLPDTERARLKKILKEVVPEGAGVIVRTAAEGASEEELRADVERLTAMWERIQAKQKSGNAPVLLHGEPDMTVRVIRDVFNEDFTKLVVSGDTAWTEVSDYIASVAPDLADRVEQWTGDGDVFAHFRVHEALAKAMERKVWLPSGGSLVIDRTEAMTVVDVNTGKFVGSGGNLEETVTKNNIEAAEEIVRQLRLRDIGGIIVIDFIDMVLESNRDLVVRRLLECLGRDRTKHQVAEVTSLGLVQMTRKRVGAGLIEVFSEPCTHCSGRGIVVHPEPIDRPSGDSGSSGGNGGRGRGGDGGRRGRSGNGGGGAGSAERNVLPQPNPNGPTPAQIAAAAHAAAQNAGGAAEAKAAEQAATAADLVPAATAPAEGPVAATPAGADPVAEAPEAPEAPEPPARRKRRGRVTAPVTAPEAVTEAAEVVQQQEAAPRTPEDSVPVAEETPSAPEGTSEVSEPVVEQVVTRPRRKRGRVVAPAGPPSANPAGEAD